MSLLKKQSEYCTINIKKIFVIALLSLVFTTKVSAQLKASFTADKTSGCITPALIVNFKNTTQNVSASASYYWDFGSGNTSALASPSTSFRDPKTYTVTLTVKDGSQTSTATTSITVHKNPIADFSASSLSGCVPMTVNFTDKSNPVDGTIDKYVWDFGDGNINSGANLSSTSNTYNFSQKYTVGLTVTNNFGCESAPTTKTDLITTNPEVFSAFSATKTTLCSTAESVSFINNSTISDGTLTYLWDFGDGTSSTDKNPTHSYAAKGIYTVKLTSTSDKGCTNVKTMTDYINVANFKSSIILPSSPICQDASLSFSGVANPTPVSSKWYFSDNNSSYPYDYGLNVVYKSFYNAGSYTATLINNFGGCNDTATSSFVVAAKPQQSSFVFDNKSLCGAPVTVNFKDTSSEAVSWKWNFNYYGNSTLQNPSFTFNANGNYTVDLTIKNAAGCSSSGVTEWLSINPPNEYIEHKAINTNLTNNLGGCEGLTFVFNATPLGSISKYSWKFGDGTTSTDSMPTHSFPNAGNYNVILNYTTTGGCTRSASVNDINIYKKPTANFYTNDTLVCGNTPVNLMNTSLQANGYSFFSFNDSLQLSNYSSTNTSYQFYYPGTYSVTLIVRNGDDYGNGYCYDTITKKDYIKVFPPFPKISGVTHTCDGTRGDVVISQQSRLAKGWIWDYGDNTYDTLHTDQPTITHTYKKSGYYKVVQTAINGSCAVRDSLEVPVLLKQSPLLTIDKTETCGSDDIIVNATHFDAGITGVNNTLHKVEYGDGTQFNGGIDPYSYRYGGYWYTDQFNNVTFSKLQDGENDIRLITQSEPFYCYDTTNYAKLKIKGPIVNYMVGGSECFKKAISLVDTSAHANVVPVKTWQWSFGDGSTQQTNIDSVQHIYTDPGSYYTSLKVIDNDGCTASTSIYGYDHMAVATGPKADFSWSPSNISPNSTATYYNASNDYGSSYNEYTWHFSSDNSSSTNSYSLLHDYTNALTDTVRLIAKSDVSTCIDTIVKLVPIRNSNISFTFSTRYINNNTCPPMIVNFTSTTYNILKVKWFFGNGKTATNNFNPSNTYNGAGTYKVTLIGYGYNNEADTVYGYVTVKGPYADITTDKTEGCLPVTFTLTARNRTSDSLLWDFGDGILLRGKDSTITHTYNSSGDFNPALIISDTSGCQSTLQLPVNIISDTLGASFMKSPIVQCIKAPAEFNLSVQNVAVNYIDSALTYHWDFGTSNPNDTSNVKDPFFIYNTPGRYKITFAVNSVTGCADTIKDSIIVKPIAPPTITGAAVICEDVPTQYLATITTTDSVGWYWQFNNGKTDTTQKPALQSFKAYESVDSIFVVSNLNGCPDTAFYPVTINAKPHINLLPQENDTLCLGKSLQLTAHDGIIYRWYPITFITDTTAYNPTITPIANATYWVTVTNINGCINTDSAVVTVAQPITLKLAPETNVCIHDSVQLNVSGAATYKWTTNTATLSDSLINNPIARTLTDALYTVTGYDSYNCFTDTKSTQVYIRPLPTITGGKQIEMPVGTSTAFIPQVSSDVVSYSWTPIDYLSCANCFYPIVEPRSNIQYTFTGKTIYGCFDTTTFGIKLKCVGLTLTMPNAFTPGKSINNRFYPLGKGVKIIKRFAIYSRTGEVLFEKNNFNINDASYGWDGKYNGIELLGSTYVYVLEATCDTGEDLRDKGTVVLIR